jgi:photosystem II stability/assembly factor-like uncharacterized protein
MKKLLIILFILGFITNLIHAQSNGWIKLNLDSIPGDPFFTDVAFSNADTGWLTPDQTIIYRTDDGAATFNAQSTSFGSTNAVHMMDANYSYVGGEGGWVYKTTTGGFNWNILTSMGSELLDISVPPGTNPNLPVGYACGGNGQVWRIDSTLTNLNTGLATTFSGISSPSVNNVWFRGGNLIYYFDGATFTSQSHPSGTFNHIHLINNQEGWVVGNAGIISHTTNGGASWIAQTNPDSLSRSLYGVFFLNSNEGWAVGNLGVILSTSNGGNTWTVNGDGLTSNNLTRACFNSPSNGYVSGVHKTILKYTKLNGIKENEQTSEINIFPNPTSGMIKLKIPNNQILEAVVINDMMGRRVIQKDNVIINEIDLQTLTSGFYAINIATNKQRYFGKIIKQ